MTHTVKLQPQTSTRRRLHRAVGLATIACLAGASAVALAAPSAASACPSLKHVKSFHGHASIRFSGTASGEDQSSGGSETVTLHHKVAQAQIKLTDFAREPGRILVAGTVSGGTVTVNDSYDNTGSDTQGSETYSGPINDPIGTGVELVVDRQTCRWKLGVSVQVKGVSFKGDTANPGTAIYQDADSKWHDISNSLHAVSSDTDHVYYGRCPKRVVKHGRACFTYGAAGRTTTTCSTGAIRSHRPTTATRWTHRKAWLTSIGPSRRPSRSRHGGRRLRPSSTPRLVVVGEHAKAEVGIIEPQRTSVVSPSPLENPDAESHHRA